MGDNQRSSSVVIAGFCSFGALDHQRRVLHESSLPYLSEDRDSTSYQSVKRSANNNTRQNLFCLVPYTRQRQTLGKAPSAANDSKRPLALPNVGITDTRQMCDLPSAFSRHLEKHIYFFPFSIPTFFVVILDYLELHI
jgi:hypothetical protein